MTKKSLLFVMSIFLVSCQTAQDPLTNKTNNNFNKKAIDNNDKGIEYIGDWFKNDTFYERRRNDEKPNSGFPEVAGGTAKYSATQDKVNQNRAKLDDVAGGYVAESYNIEEDDTIYPITKIPSSGDGAWTSELTNTNNSKPSGNGYLINDGKPYPILESQENSTNIPNINIFTRLNEYSINNYKYLSSVLPANKPTIYSSTSWIDKGDYKYSYNKNSYAEYEFSGTNISLMTKKGKNPGWNNLKTEIYTKVNGVYPTIPQKIIDNIDMYNPTEIDYELKINNLKYGDHKLIIKSASISRSQGKNSFLIAIGTFAKIQASAQYEFEGKNISYKAFKFNTCGTVNVTVDDQPTKQISLYSTNTQPQATISEYVFGARLNTNKRKIYDSNNNLIEVPHTITIEASGEKARDQNGNIITNSGVDINIDQLGKLPEIEGSLTDSRFNVFFAKGNDFGKVDLYVNDIYSRTINLNENKLFPPNPNFSGNFVDNVIFTTKFTLVPAFDQNLETNKFKVSFDAYSRVLQRAIFQFNVYDSGKLYFRGATGKDQGIASLKFNGNVTPKLLNLFGSEVAPSIFATGIQSEFDVTPGNNQILEVSPSTNKSPNSTSYNINISSLDFKSTSNQDLSIDLVCTP